MLRGTPRSIPPSCSWRRSGQEGKGSKCSTSNVLNSTWAGRKLILETGKIARQADGAVLATYGETVVLATVVVRQGAEGRASTSSR